MTVQIFDRFGELRDWNWLIGKYGPVSISESAYTHAYRLVRIDERQGHASHIVKLIDAEGAPVSGITVIRHWVGIGPEHQLPAWTEPPERWFERGVYGETNDNGDIGFGMGHGDLYYPPNKGASSVWVGHKEGDQMWGSDCFSGLGWIVAETDLHLDVVFQRMESEPPPPEDDWETKVLRHLWTINNVRLPRVIELLEGLAG